MRRLSLASDLVLTLTASALLPTEEKEGPWSSGDFGALAFRGIGPALTSGRIGDFAVDPRDPYHYYVGVCSGGVWETKNAGVTFTPIFDGEGSFSIGCVTMAPSHPDIVWVGTGENNSQRSVAYGDGVYKSVDGGQSWKNMGLERSLHIGKIIVHPTNPDVVYVAAMGPLWGPGGDRGVYKTTDGGENWELVLEIDENTGVVDLADGPPRSRRPLRRQLPAAAPRLDPDQRRSRVGHPQDHRRRRHLDRADQAACPGWTWAASAWPSRRRSPDTVYAIVEAAEDKGGFFRSTDARHELGQDERLRGRQPPVLQRDHRRPREPRPRLQHGHLHAGDRGRRQDLQPRGRARPSTWTSTPCGSIPANTDHLLTGNDGGVYESFDRGENWRFMANLPVTQFYRVAVDYDEPFYNVYGGTQDNNTQGGPSRTHLRPRHQQPRMVHDSWAATASNPPSTPPTPTSSTASGSTAT